MVQGFRTGPCIRQGQDGEIGEKHGVRSSILTGQNRFTFITQASLFLRTCTSSYSDRAILIAYLQDEKSPLSLKASGDSKIWCFTGRAYLQFLNANNMQVCQPVQSVTLTYCSREEQKQNMTTRNHLQQCKK